MGKKSKYSTIKALGIGIVTLVLGGLLLSGLQGVFFKKEKNTSPNKPTVISKPIIKIQSKLAGRYVILGTNKEGVWATKSFDKERYLWHHVVIHIQNDCKKPIYINARKFKLYLSKNQNTSGEKSFIPTNEGIKFQTKRLSSELIEPGKSITGDLYFKVPKSKLSNGLDVNKAYSILRYTEGLKCEINYTAL